jgi:ATP-independent RNA helicase DbpA
MSDTAFSSLQLAAPFLANLEQLGYATMTAVQAAALPHAFSGRDLIVQAKTGSGKTAAFGIGMLQGLNATLFAPQGLVLCPTRELADQVANELRRLARGIGNVKVVTLTGGVPMRPQMASLEFGAHLQRQTLDLARLRTLVLDEADRMTDMGFGDEIAAIARECPSHRQTLLFSATYPEDIRAITAKLMRDPLEIAVETQHEAAAIEQRCYEIGFDGRDRAVARVLRHVEPGSAIVFCNTKAHCRELADFLRAQGFAARALYGEMEQRDRDETLVLFNNRTCSVLVATDVAARGIDVAGMEAVINADVAKDPEVHVHRVGRTGRAGQTGLAITLCAPNEKRFLALAEELQGVTIEREKIDALGEDEGLTPDPAPMVTLCVAGGKKDKMRPGDLLGALAKDAGLLKEQVGKIHIAEFASYVAIDRRVADQAVQRLSAGNPLGADYGSIKGRNFKLRLIEA